MPTRIINGKYLVERYILPTKQLVADHWVSLAKEFDEITTIEQILEEEPNSQLAKLWTFLTDIQNALVEVDSPATAFEILVCQNLKGIIRELDGLGEDSEAF